MIIPQLLLPVLKLLIGLSNLNAFLLSPRHITPSCCMLVLIDNTGLVRVIEARHRGQRVQAVGLELQRLTEDGRVLLGLQRELALVVAAYLQLIVADVVLFFQVV